jgi:hypothetical protein
VRRRAPDRPCRQHEALALAFPGNTIESSFYFQKVVLELVAPIPECARETICNPCGAWLVAIRDNADGLAHVDVIQRAIDVVERDVPDQRI